MPDIVSRSIRRLVEAKSASLLPFRKKDDVIYLDYLRKKNSLLLVKSTALAVHSTLALLSYLQLCMKPSYNIYAMPQVEPKPESELLNFVSSKKVELCVVFEQATPYLDGFYLMVPPTLRRDRSEEIIDFVMTKGHEIGVYSIEEDRPTYPLVHSRERLLKELGLDVGEVYGFGISDDIWAGVNATAFVLGDFDFGITAREEAT
jgi:hypothetical protein